jgi:hypothetical protein
LFNFRVWAQDDDEPFNNRVKGRDISDVFEMDGMTDYQPFHISITEIILVVLLIVACYVFGKIWKGCSYLLLVVAALLFYLTRS